MALLNKYGYGEGTGDVAKKNDDRLTNDETYRNDEVTRTRDVIKKSNCKWGRYWHTTKLLATTSKYGR